MTGDEKGPNVRTSKTNSRGVRVFFNLSTKTESTIGRELFLRYVYENNPVLFNERSAIVSVLLYEPTRARAYAIVRINNVPVTRRTRRGEARLPETTVRTTYLFTPFAVGPSPSDRDRLARGF